MIQVSYTPQYSMGACMYVCKRRLGQHLLITSFLSVCLGNYMREGGSLFLQAHTKMKP